MTTLLYKCSFMVCARDDFDESDTSAHGFSCAPESTIWLSVFRVVVTSLEASR